MAIVRFVQGGAGRVIRTAVGAALVVVGLVLGGGWLGLSVVGLVPLAAGIFDVCLLAPVFHQPFRAAHSPKA